ncbi:spermatogenesis-associated serine-rich protein 1-like [Anneissia japonica]|uniref:spermatogenesis-associated serine-rich protein 1-like n=1 Tax=Anneissia japonica TaxID=1529436 RepID=UPI001425574A|nr:spermatogenesis-associated serine-rich protein 1-like [Anneissia japonica]
MAQHIITEVGVPGKKERERRHFQEEKGKTKIKPSGRVYIHPGYGTQPDWKPHGKSIEVKYSSNGPDWESRISYIPHPSDPEAKHPQCLPIGQRSFPDMTRQTYGEWTYYPDNTVGKKCFFTGSSGEIQHINNLTSANEITHSMLYGKRRKYNSIWQKREFPYASPGDKNYQVVEYSPNFHKRGSCRPIVNFGGPPTKKPDTFVPLQKLPEITREPYVVKERQRRLQDDVAMVHDLSSWKPAMPLVSPDDVRYLNTLY